MRNFPCFKDVHNARYKGTEIILNADDFTVSYDLKTNATTRRNFLAVEHPFFEYRIYIRIIKMYL